ncbi:MAG: hypothetical protein N2249_04350 [Melioribacter sp.]|nr:hypothetical protein [Melioribacter sp.]
MITKQKLTKYLFALTVLLLIVDVSIDFIYKPKKNKSSESEFSCAQLDSIFYNVLDEFGIESQWISYIKIKIADEDSIQKKIIVKIPEDLPIPVIIKDFQEKVENDITSFVSEEKKIYGTTEIRIYSNEYLKLVVELIPDNKIVRNRNELSFIISNVFELNEKDFNEFLSIPYKFSATVIPSDDMILLAQNLKNYSKEYIVLINDDIKDSQFELNFKSHKEVLRNSIKNIISAFSEAQLFCIDETSKLFNSTVYNFIRDEFQKRKRPLVPLSEFIHLNSDDEVELISKFKFYVEDTTMSKQKIFYLPYENFTKIRSEFDRMRKKGNKVISLSSTQLFKGLIKNDK